MGSEMCIRDSSKFTEIEIPDTYKIIKEKSVGDVKALLLQKK